MAKFFVLVALIAVAHGNSVNRISGWGQPTTSTTAAPSTTTEAATTTTPGWSPTSSTTTTSGWSAPSNSNGWGQSSTNVTVTGDLAATGSGWASENHAENIQVTGGWGVPAELTVVAAGDSELSQQGSIVQVTNVDDSSASAVNAISVAQSAGADETLAVIASGLDVAVAQSGAAAATGAGTSSAAGESIITATH